MIKKISANNSDFFREEFDATFRTKTNGIERGDELIVDGDTYSIVNTPEKIETLWQEEIYYKIYLKQ